MGSGIRSLKVEDHLLNCEMLEKGPGYCLDDIISESSLVLDIGCGGGKKKYIVEKNGGRWIGVERFSGGAENVTGDAQCLPFASEIFDVIIMDAVMEHIPNINEALCEVSRVLKRGGF